MSDDLVLSPSYILNFLFFLFLFYNHKTSPHSHHSPHSSFVFLLFNDLSEVKR